MADEPKRPYLTQFQATKAYHRPGWEHYAAKVEAERQKAFEDRKVVLKEKRMNAGSTHYTFSVVQKRDTKPYLRISVFAEKIDYRGTIVVFAPYVPTFMSKLRELANGLE